MIAVAVVGVVLAAAIEVVRLRRVAALHLSRATAHAREEITCLKGLRRFAEEERAAVLRDREIRSLEARSPSPSPEDADALRRAGEQNGRLLAEIRAALASCARRYDYHGRMRRKYAAAASRPWSSVAPDPVPE
jgi:hypothetical protein